MKYHICRLSIQGALGANVLLTVYKVGRETWRQCVARYVQQNAEPRHPNIAIAYKVAAAVQSFDAMRSTGTGPRLAAIRAILSHVQRRRQNYASWWEYRDEP